MTVLRPLLDFFLIVMFSNQQCWKFPANCETHRSAFLTVFYLLETFVNAFFSLFLILKCYS